MRINQNVAAFNAWRNLTVTDSMMNKSLEKLTSVAGVKREFTAKRLSKAKEAVRNLPVEGA